MTQGRIIPWNSVIYRDCMDPEYGLPSLPDKSFDLCLTDPPFNVKFKGKQMSTYKTKMYQDNMKYEDYKSWCTSWFTELERVCVGIVIFCGNPNLWMWSDIKHPRDLVIHYKKNVRSRASASYLSVYDSILVYGKLKRLFSLNVIEQLREYQPINIHPCPGNLKLYYKILFQLKPKSVLDIFMGSGTAAAAATKLGIKWLGYEINKIYSQDIEKRLKNCKKEPIQQTLL